MNQPLVRTVAPYAISAIAGMAAGLIFWIFAVPSPVPPLLGLVGLLGIVVGERGTTALVERFRTPRARESLEDLIRAKEAERYASMLAGNASAFRKLADPRLVYTHPSGATDNRESYSEKLASGRLRYNTIHHEVQAVTVSGAAVTVVGTIDATSSYDGRPTILHSTSLSIWTLASGRWLLLASQSTSRSCDYGTTTT